MAAPVDAARATYDGSTSTTTHAVTLPGGIAAGDILVMCVRTPTTIGSFTWPAGWTKLDTAGDRGIDASDDFQQIAWRIADGSEGATVTVTLNVAARLAALTYRITGGTRATLSAIASGTSANPNSPAHTVVPPNDVLWLSVGGIEGARTITTAPSGYANATIIANTGTTGTGQCSVFGASLGVTGDASEDPGAWTLSASDDWMIWTVAVYTAIDAAIVSQDLAEVAILPSDQVARTSQVVSETAILPADQVARTSQVVGEVAVLPADQVARVSQVVVEVAVLQENPQSWVSQVAMEVAVFTGFEDIVISVID